MMVLAVLTATRMDAEVTTNELRWSQLPPLPGALGVAGAFAGVSDGKLIVAGGANFPDKMPWEGGQKVWHDTVYVLDQTNTGWRVAGKLPRPLAYGISLTTEYGVLCIGGSDATRHYANTFLLTWANGEIVTHELPPLPVPLANAAGALVGQVAYVAGGSEAPGEQAALDRCFALELTALAEPILPSSEGEGESRAAAAGGSNSESKITRSASGKSHLAWTELSPCPGEARILPAAGATTDAFYLMGGAALRLRGDKVKRVYLRDAWKYSPSSGNWERLADLPRPSVAAPSPAPIVDATLLLIGGDDGSLVNFQPMARHPGFPRVAQALDLRTGNWSQLDHLPVARATLPAVRWRGLFVLPSGEVRPGVRSPEVWAVRGNGRD